MEFFAGDETGAGSILYSAEMQPNSLDQGDIAQFSVSSTPKSSLESKSKFLPMAGSSESSSVSGLSSKWEMKLGKKEWKKGEKRDGPEDPVNLGTIFTGSHVIPEEVNIFAATVPVLEQILVALNKDRKSSGKQDLVSLYSSWISQVAEKDEDGDPSVVERRFVKLNESSLLLFLSDQGPGSTSPFNLTFKKNLGIDATLPVLFQSMYFDPSFEGDEVSGGLFVHDPTMRENKGSRYVVQLPTTVSALEQWNDACLQVFHSGQMAGSSIRRQGRLPPEGAQALCPHRYAWYQHEQQ